MDDLNPVQTARAPGQLEQGEARERAFCQRIARVAVRSLYAELVLYPKPGLVSKVDNGSHTDMTACWMRRSTF
jgi:triphosphoribosyl-dephospho-CoA synthase